jgi:Xaa-Pro aminopeptidase
VAASTARHRAALSTSLPGVAIVVSGGAAMLRNDDAYFAFRPDSDFLWLTGCAAENAVLVMTPVAGGHDAALFLPEPYAPGSPGYFGERNHSRFWVGESLDLAEWSDALQIVVRPLAEAQAAVGAAARDAELLAAGRPTDLPTGLPPRSTALATTLSELRLVKDEWEIAQLRKAVDASIGGFAAVAHELGAAIESGGERWLQGTFDRHARVHGNGPGYASIVGAGPNAPVLHWTRCDGPVRPDHLVLLDAGVEVDTFYTADVTRTFPAGGTFSPAQRSVYDLVRRSHEAGISAVRPGATFSDFHHASMEVLVRGLDDWGLLPVSVDEALSDEGQQHRRYLVCGVGHHLGLDLHDCSQARHNAYQGAELLPGMVLTVEPGLYFHENDLLLPPELRGIGVRNEDDIVVTNSGVDVLTAALPIDAAEIERWVVQAAS